MTFDHKRTIIIICVLNSIRTLTDSLVMLYFLSGLIHSPYEVNREVPCCFDVERKN